MRLIRRLVELVKQAGRWVGTWLIPRMRRGKRDKTPLPVQNFTARYDNMSNARIAWTWPTNRVEGEALPESQIEHCEISMSADGGANFSGVAQVPPPATEHVVADLAAGTYIFRAVVVDKDGRRSAAVDATAGVLSDPNPVGDLTVTIE